MTLQKESNCICPLGGVMDIISKKWALLVINTIGNSQKIRYNEIRNILGEINSKVLSDRLKELEEAGLIKREAYAEIPPRVEYSLTEDGEALREAISPLMRWVFSKNVERTNTPCDIAYLETHT
jgi:DNA-binding HxlR family transcriptional regulator